MRTVIVRNVALTSISVWNSLGLHAYCIQLGLLSASPIAIGGAIASYLTNMCIKLYFMDLTLTFRTVAMFVDV